MDEGGRDQILDQADVQRRDGGTEGGLNKKERVRFENTISNKGSGGENYESCTKWKRG